MNLIKKLLLISLSVIMAFSAVPTLGAEQVNTFLKENFNSITTGGMPSGDFTAKKAGGAELGVVEIPDAKNKSIYMRGTTGGAASLIGNVSNPELVPITVSFRFMLPEFSDFSLPRIEDESSVSNTILDFCGSVLKSGNTIIADLKTKRWYYTEITFNLSENTYRITLDENIVQQRWSFEGNGIKTVSFEVSGANANIYLDDLAVTRATVGGKDRESWPSKMWTSDAQQQVVDDISLSNFTMFNMSKVAYKSGVKMEMPAPVREIDKNLYVPLRFTAENIGAEVVWNEQENAVYMMFGGKTTKVSAGASEAFVDGAAQPLSHEVKSVDGTTYIYYADIATLLGREVNQQSGYIMFGPDWDYYQKSETAVKEELYRMVKYQRPDGDKIFETLVNNNPEKNHPRLFARDEDFERLKSLWQTDEFAKQALDYLKARADEFLNAAVTPYVQPGSSARMYSVRRPHEIINTCSMMYHLTGNADYAERAKKELLNMVSFPELGHLAILDLGDTGECISVGYDWLYNYEGFTEEDKKSVRDAVIEKFIPPLLYCYRGGEGVDEKWASLDIRSSWVYSRYNFNSHINLGAVMCMLALGDDFESSVVENSVKPILNYALRSLEFFFDEWYPDGAWHEGPGYGTAVIQQMAHIIDAINSATGTTFGFLDVPGIFESGIWGLYVEGPTGMFNYSDAGDGTNAYASYSFWMSETLDENIFASKRKEQLIDEYFSSLEAIEMLWYDPQRCIGFTPPAEPDKYFRNVETTMMRSGWGENDLYAGFHSGLNGINHAHIDTGSFVLDWGGTRWVKDIGVDEETSHWYGDADDWGTGYRERAEGHNTIVIDNTKYKTYADDEWPVVFEDDFEGYEIDSDPSKFKISEGNANTNAQGEVGVVNVERAKIGDNNQNKAMRLEQSRELKTSFYAHKAFGAIKENFVKNELELSFKFKLEKFDESGDMNFINFYSPDYTSPEGVTTAHGTVFGLNIQKGYVLRSQNGSGYTTLATLDPTKWYDMKFRVDVKSQTMNIWIGEDHLGVDLKLPKTIVGISYVRFSSAGIVDFEAFVDDVVIKVSPEDKALALTAARLYDQTLYCNSPITAFESKPKGSYAITDMTAAYIDWANSARRGVMLTDNRNTFIVRDEISLKEKSDVYWFAHSAKADVEYEILEGGKSAILHTVSDGKRTGTKMWAGIISDNENAKLEVYECNPLPGSPTPSNQADNSIFHKLTVKLEGVEGNVDLSVAFIPLTSGDTPQSIPAEVSLDNWSIEDGEIPALDTLTLNGVQIENFEPGKTTYSISVRSDEAVPYVGAMYMGQSVNVNQAETLYDSATFEIGSGEDAVKYEVNFIVEAVVYAEIQGHLVSEDDILYSSLTEEFGLRRMFDRNMTTSGASLGSGEWMIFDFGQPKELSKIEIAWMYGEGRNYKFDILYSNDGNTWETAFSGASSGAGEDFETYEFGKTINAKLLKFVGYGNNKNLYNNIIEMR